MKTHCKSGHEFTPENTSFRWNVLKNGKKSKCRRCKLCKKKEDFSRRNMDVSIDSNTFQLLHQEQDGKCRICHKAGKLCLDHDHETNEIRGLLCPACNLGLGLFRDSIESLNEAIAYLKRTSIL